MSRAKKSTVVEPQELPEAEPVEQAAVSGEVELSEAIGAPVEAEAVSPATLTCGPLRLKQEGKGFGWQQSRLGAGPFADVGVSPGPHGWGGFAMLGQTCVAKSKATHPRPEQAAAELAENITTALSEARARQAAAAARVRAGGSASTENTRQGRPDLDLLGFCQRVGWEQADSRNSTKQGVS